MKKTAARGAGPANIEVVGLSGIHLYREERLVLKDLELSVRQGEHWVLLGPNGSGKSSLLAVLQGLLWPIEGEMRVLGRRFGEDDLSAMRRLIGWVGNDLEPDLPRRQSVLQIVLSGCVGTVGIRFDQPTAADRRHAAALLRRMGLGGLASRPYGQLSQGQTRLVTIARALMVKPGLLILDEPAAGLDPVAREMFLARLGRLMKTPRGPVILYVTHHVEEIIPAFTHGLVLRQGRVLASGRIGTCLDAKILGKAFGRKVRLVKSGGRYALRLAGPRQGPA